MTDHRRRLSATIALASVTLLFAAACGDEAPSVSTGSGSDGSPSAGAQGPSSGQVPANPGVAPSSDDLVVSCGAVTFEDLPADPSSFPPLGDIEGVIDLEPIQGEHEFFEVHDWYVVSETDDELLLFGIPHEPVVEGPAYGNATLERAGDRWVPQGWGGCRVSVDAPGWGNARFVLDPDVEPDPEASSISVQAWEMNCASGEVPEGRDVRPVVLSEDETTVSVVVLVEPVTGDADCQGNPSFPLEIELAAPLGERTVVDTSVDPALERPWPPTESSLMSNGMEE